MYKPVTNYPFQSCYVESLFSGVVGCVSGITLLVLGCLLLVLGIVEFAIPPFASRGSIFAIIWVVIMAGAIGVSAGKDIIYSV